MACQYGRPAWGDLALAQLPATVRTVMQAGCAGPDVPAFWAGLGFVPQYELMKQGHVAEVRRGEWTVHVLVSRLLRVARSGTAAAAAAAGAELVPGQVLVEAWADVGPGSNTDAMAAMGEVGKLLGREGVALQQLPMAPKGWRAGRAPAPASSPAQT